MMTLYIDFKILQQDLTLLKHAKQQVKMDPSLFLSITSCQMLKGATFSIRASLPTGATNTLRNLADTG